MSAMEVGNDGGMARELLRATRQEQTGLWMQYCCLGARLVFLFSHGVLVILISASAGNASRSWWSIFSPVWLGDGLCILLLVASWFASCPYIRLCLAQKQSRVGDDNPSILTDLLPGIVLAVLGLLFLVLILVGEYWLCRYLDSAQQGALSVADAFLTIVALLAICHGACLTTDTAIFSFLGGGLLVTTVIFSAAQASDSDVAKAFVVFPGSVAIVGLLLVASHRLLQAKAVLSREERALLTAECLSLLLMLVVSLTLAWKVGRGRLVDVGLDGGVLGLGMCSIALLRARLGMVQHRGRPVALRLLLGVRPPEGREASTPPVEVQIP